MNSLPSSLRLLLIGTLASLAGAQARADVPTEASNVNPVEVGSEAPDPSVRRADGSEASLSALLAGEPAIVVFYRGGWCPYCNRQLEALASLTAELEALGLPIIGLSADRPERVAEAIAATAPDYTLVSDAGMGAAQAFGLAFKVDAASYERLQGFGIDLEAASGETHHLLPVPAVFLIDGEGIIAFRYFNPDYRKRLSAEELLVAARALTSRGEE